MAHVDATVGRAAMLSVAMSVVPTLEEVVEKERARCPWCSEEFEFLLKYRDVVKRALLEAVKSARSCVLRYEYIYDAVYSLIEDEDEAWYVENALYSVITFDGVKIDDIVVYKIYLDNDTSENDVVVVLIDDELTDAQIKMLNEIAELFATSRYDRFVEEEQKFYDATPVGAYERTEVYTVLHNLVCRWTNCRNVIQELEEEEGEEEEDGVEE